MKPNCDSRARSGRASLPAGELASRPGSPGGSPARDGSDRPASSLSSLAAGLLSGRWAAGRGHGDTAVRPTPRRRCPSPTRRTRFATAPIFAPSPGWGSRRPRRSAHAHDQGIVHRDIKPANILLNRKGELWVADFGMADVQGRDGLTMTGDLPGTLRYMSPEQALGKRSLVDRRTDIYALGATLYELLALRPVVPGTDKQEMLRRIADDEPEPLRKLNPAVPVDLATIVAKCLAKDPANRYQTAWQLGDELTRFLDGRPIAARPVGSLARTWRWCRRKPVQASLAAGLMLCRGRSAWRGSRGTGASAVRLSTRPSTKGCCRSQQRRPRARSERSCSAPRPTRSTGSLIDKLLLQAAPEHNTNARTLTLRAALDHAAAEVATSFQGQPQIEAAIRLALGQTYHELGEFARSEAHFRRSLELLRQKERRRARRIRRMTELGHILDHLDRNDRG